MTRDDRIVASYQAGNSLRAIGVQEHLSYEWVRIILMRRNVPLRGKWERTGPPMSHENYQRA